MVDLSWNAPGEFIADRWISRRQVNFSQTDRSESYLLSESYHHIWADASLFRIGISRGHSKRQQRRAYCVRRTNYPLGSVAYFSDVMIPYLSIKSRGCQQYVSLNIVTPFREQYKYVRLYAYLDLEGEKFRYGIHAVAYAVAHR